jgi:hypothetical protein
MSAWERERGELPSPICPCLTVRLGRDFWFLGGNVEHSTLNAQHRTRKRNASNFRWKLNVECSALKPNGSRQIPMAAVAECSGLGMFTPAPGDLFGFGDVCQDRLHAGAFMRAVAKRLAF